MAWEVVVGSAVMAFLSAYLIFKFGEFSGEHIVYQILLFGFLIFSVVSLGGAVFSAANCPVVPVNATSSGEITTYNYERVCLDQEQGSSETFVRLTSYFGWLSVIYLLVFAIYKYLLFIGKLGVKKRK